MEDKDGVFEPYKLVIGLYGISGAGKSRCLSLLQKERPEWRCVEGSQVLEQVLKDRGYPGLDALKRLVSQDAAAVRREAAQRIQSFAGVTVVAGHCSFPKSADTLNGHNFDDVFTEADGITYNAIVYLDLAANTVCQQRSGDELRARPKYDASFLERWICHEKEVLEEKCNENNIVFAVVQPDDVLNCIAGRFVHPWVESVLQRSKVALERALLRVPAADVYLMIDGDRTFTPIDSGRAFFHAFGAGRGENSDTLDGDPLKRIFSRHPVYCPQAFVEAAMLYTSIGSHEDYKYASHEVGLSQVHPYDAWLPFLSSLPPRVHAMLISCSNRDVWAAVLEREGLVIQNRSPGGPSMSLIAGNHLGLHSYVVDIEAKGFVVRLLRHLHPGCKVISFGDSILDQLMMEASDRSYVILDGERRNRSLQPFLTTAVTSRRPSLFQIGLSNAGTCWYHDGVPFGSLRGLLQELTDGSIHAVLDVSSYRRSAAILAAQTRRADLPPPSLQAVHERVGRFLADATLDEFSFDETLFEEAQYDHVQGSSIAGCVARSSDAAILALMRGGEPMARGLFAKLPSATFVFYWNDDQPLTFDDKDRRCPVQRIYVVDSVINRGDSVRRVLRRLENASSSSSSNEGARTRGGWSVFVLSGVMQEAAAESLPREFPRVRFVTLRVSSNQYSGSGGTDTGNRLFGTL